MNNKPHKYAELIKKWADGAVIQYYDSDDKEWIDISRSPTWDSRNMYRVKPEVTTSLSNNELWDIYYKTLGYPGGRSGGDMTNNNSIRAVADAAIKQYIKENPK